MMFRVILNAERDMVYRFQPFIGGYEKKHDLQHTQKTLE